MRTPVSNRLIQSSDTTETALERPSHLGLILVLSLLAVGVAYFVDLYVIKQ
jgi:hypothetical protein